jgi:hypothetical protein
MKNQGFDTHGHRFCLKSWHLSLNLSEGVNYMSNLAKATAGATVLGGEASAAALSTDICPFSLNFIIQITYTKNF